MKRTVMATKAQKLRVSKRSTMRVEAQTAPALAFEKHGVRVDTDGTRRVFWFSGHTICNT